MSIGDLNHPKMDQINSASQVNVAQPKYYGSKLGAIANFFGRAVKVQDHEGKTRYASKENLLKYAFIENFVKTQLGDSSVRWTEKAARDNAIGFANDKTGRFASFKKEFDLGVTSRNTVLKINDLYSKAISFVKEENKKELTEQEKAIVGKKTEKFKQKLKEYSEKVDQ